MALARWEPFRELARMQEEFNRLFDHRLHRWRGVDEELATNPYPAVDIFEDVEGLVLTAELPGVDPKDVDLRVENGVLLLKAERRLENADRKENYRRVERVYGTFMRSFTLPAHIDGEKVRAEFKNGVLRVMLPKKEESRPRSIKVVVE